MQIGFVGLGNMGEPIAANLMAAGHQVTVWNRTPSKAQALISKGAKLAADVKEASNNSIVFTMLADDAATEEILANGLLNSLPKEGIHISLSTISVAMAQKLNQLHQDHGQAYVSAPVFGRPEAAAAKQLYVVAAGNRGAIDKARPYLDAIGQQVLVLGEDPSQANIVKISGNFLIAAAMEAMGEAIALVRQHGVDPVQYIGFLTNSLFSAPVYKNYGMKIAKQEFEPVGFRIPLALKDVRLALAAGEAKHTPLPLASLLRDQVLTTMAHYGEDVDWAMIGKLAADHARLK